MKNTARGTESRNVGTKAKLFDSVNAGEDDEHTSVGFVEIFQIFVMRKAISLRKEPFGRM